MINGHLVRTADGEVLAGGLRPATTVPTVRLGGWGPAGGENGVGAGVGAGAPNGHGNGQGNGYGNGYAAGGGHGLAPAFAPPSGPMGPGTVPADQVLVEYFRAANQLIGAGHDLVLNYLGYAPTAPPAGVPMALAPAPGVVPVVEPGTATAPAAPVAAPAPAQRPALSDPAELLARLTAIVSARTGYPEEMLGPDLDVEADLSIDSIKRLEILSELADDIGVSDDGSLDTLEDLVQELAARKTLQGIVDFLFEHADRLGAEPGAGDAVAAPQPQAPTSTPAPASRSMGGAVGATEGIPALANRFVVGLVDAPLGPVAELAGRSIRVTGSNPVATAMVGELVGRGANVGDTGDLVVVTDLLDDDAAGPVPIPELYRRLRPLLVDTTCDVLVVSPLGGGLGVDPPAPPSDDGGLPAGAGVRGLVKTAAVELADREVRLVDVDPVAPAAGLATIVADEVAQTGAPLEVAWRDGQRRTSQITVRTTTGDGAELALDAESVVLLTGGGRGITARVAVALAQQSGCRIELVGRSARPDGDEDPAIAAATDRPALRAALVGAGWREPQAIERECDRILSEREVGATFAALAAAGSAVVYHQVDVRDAEALAGVVRSVYERHGRLDGVVHGAGMLDDHFIVDKTPEAFEQVYATKVDGARTLVAALRAAGAEGRDRPAFVAFFGSTAGVCGNRGQADYAAANDALDAMAAANRDVAGRVVAVDWGPWSPEAGMVSEALAKLFEAGGMGTIQPADGVGVLLDELAAGVGPASSPPPPPQVTVARCSPELMTAAFTQGRQA
jgi:NADP-dependent 3-hydroxy acid dehydrogenase YdfG